MPWFEVACLLATFGVWSSNQGIVVGIGIDLMPFKSYQLFVKNIIKKANKKLFEYLKNFKF